MRVPGIHAWVNGLLQRIAGRIVGHKDTFNTVLLLDYIGTDSIALLTINHIPEEYQGRPLAKTGLKAETGILVMLVEHTGEKAVPAGADTVFAVGDKLTVFGDYSAICKAFHARERFSDT